MNEKIYPSFRYFADKDPVIVNSDEEESALPLGWSKTPASFVSLPEVITEAKYHKLEALLASVTSDYREFFDKVKKCKYFDEVKKLLKEYEAD
jgi:hypothetical protein